MPATLGDHRGIIKAAVTVVNRAANKGSRGKKGKRKQGREGSMGVDNGGLSVLCRAVTFLYGDILK